MAVRHDLGALGETDEVADAPRRRRPAGRLEQLPDLEVPRPRDVPLARVALVAAPACVLVRRPNVEQRQRLVAEAGHQLLARRQRVRVRLEVGLAHRLELDRSLLELPLPPRDAAEEDRHLGVSGELGHLRRRHRADAVAAVEQHESFAARDPVAPQAQGDLLREHARRLLVCRRRRRAEHERPRAGDVAAHVRVRPTHVPDHEIVLVQVLGEPLGIDDGLHRAATMSTSLAIAGRSSSRASQSESEWKRERSTPSRSRARRIHGT